MTIRTFAAVAALALATAAHAQSMPGDANGGSADTSARGGTNDYSELNRMGRQVAVEGKTMSRRPVPAAPGDIVPGAEVRDAKGLVMATVQSVGLGYAVLVAPGGKVEVGFDSFAKNRKGLMINMPKAKFDTMLAAPKTAG